MERARLLLEKAAENNKKEESLTTEVMVKPEDETVQIMLDTSFENEYKKALEQIQDLEKKLEQAEEEKGKVLASQEIWEIEKEHLNRKINLLQQKAASFSERIQQLLFEKEEFLQKERDFESDLANKQRDLEIENKALKEKVEKLQSKQELLLEQEEEIQEERDTLKKEKEKWDAFLNEFQLTDEKELIQEYRLHQIMFEKVKERLQQVEEEYFQYKLEFQHSSEWAKEKESILAEIDILRKENVHFKELHIELETVSRMKADFRYLEEDNMKLRENYEQVYQDRQGFLQDIVELKKQIEKQNETETLKEFYRLRCRNLEEEIKRLRRIEEDSAADETKIFESFKKIVESSSKTENRLVPYKEDQAAYDRVRQLAKEAKFEFSTAMLQGFIAAMRSSRFIILKGLSGTGKTSLPRLFARAVGGECETIAVQPSWKSKTDLIGFYNHFNNRFLATSFTEALFRASLPANRDRFYFILLDEMNLARVEYYFSDFNSKLELEPEKQVVELFDSPGKTSGDLQDYIIDGHKLAIPKNVFFIGTINDDESTYSLSDKIYDRAQVLDFQEITKGTIGKMELARQQDSFHFGDFIGLQETIENTDISKELQIMDDILDSLKELFRIHIGHRPRQHMLKFLKTYKAAGWDMMKGLDLIIISKIIPKIRFSHSDSFVKNLDALSDKISRLIGSKAESIEAIDSIKRGY